MSSPVSWTVVCTSSSVPSSLSASGPITIHKPVCPPPLSPLHDKWSKILPRALFSCSKWGVDSRGFPPQSPSLFVEPSSDKRLGRGGGGDGGGEIGRTAAWGSSLDMSSAERKRDFSASLFLFHYLTITSHPSSIGFVALTSVFGIFDTYQRTDRPRERKGVSPLSLSCAGISTLAYRRLQSAKRGERQHKSRETVLEGLQRGGGGWGTDHSWDACASARVWKSFGPSSLGISC